ncbi:tetratricopeptide repeat protein [Streptomyces sp. NPDC005917]|uniref:tetratricopeptide repeat protein n=1 Tax=unclassified Streptomyces TaxID=2593676 RepID=UPI0034073B71
MRVTERFNWPLCAQLAVPSAVECNGVQQLLATREGQPLVRAAGRRRQAVGFGRSNLAGAYRAAGELLRATSLYEATLAQREQVLGDTHPDALRNRNNLAVAPPSRPSSTAEKYSNLSNRLWPTTALRSRIAAPDPQRPSLQNYGSEGL